MNTITFWDRLARLRNRALAVFAAATLGFTAGCIDRSESTAASDDSGEVLIALTDAQGDFIRYAVDVKSITLTKANGAVVETLPLTTTVDFAQYTEMTEFLTAATVPRGAYTAARMTLDYSNADIQVEGVDGTAQAAASLVDANGQAVTTLDVEIKLEGRNRLVIAPGVPASLTLDFDLAASNKVTFDNTGAATVTVEPVLVAELEPHAPKIHRVRGTLNDVNTGTDSFEVILRPFAHSIGGDDRRFGTLTVKTDADTVYEINGESFEGDAGLARLDTLTQFTAVVAVGDLKFNPRRFEAREVYAGSSVVGGTLDVVAGNVISRSGDVLTVRGATLIRTDGSVIFRDNASVTLADSTKVFKQRATGTHTIDEISVGQRVVVHGALTNTTAGSLALDASSGAVRMLRTVLRGTVVTASPLVVDLESIDGRRIALFDFAGTGASSGTDADPDNYEVDTGSLNGSGLTSGTPVKVLGFVTPFGSAPADFEARTVVNVADVRATMRVAWSPATAAPLASASSGAVVLNLDGATINVVERGGVITDLTGSSPTLVPGANDRAAYLIRHNGTVQLYTTFDTFVSGLQSRLSAGGTVQGIFGRGRYSDVTTTLEAQLIAVKM